MNKFEEELNRCGYIEIKAEIYVCTQEYMLAEFFDNEDPASNLDFTIAPFWIHDNAGMIEPLQNLTDILDYLI